MNKILRFLEKYIIPKFLYRLFQPIYHYFLVALAAFIYGFPSRKMFVIGVTGTKGKTTTCNLIAHIFNSNGLKTGMATTVNFRIGEEEWLNKTGHTMLGRFQLQKLLAKMLKLGCHYAVIETSSEGILQYRHRFIDYDMAVFTNLSSEHLERHGGFENYRTAKIKLFEKIAKKENSFGVYNLDDKNVDYFLKPAVKNKYGYQIKLKIKNQKLNHILEIEDINLLPDKSKFTVNKEDFEIPLIGEFNVYNTAAAICVAMFQNIPIKQIKKSLVNVKPIPGRMEKINEGQNFSVFVDYAHTEDALKEALSALRVFCKNKIIVVFGCGGDRDKAKRFKMGKVASEMADFIITTSDNPRSENPDRILSEIKSGISNINLYEIIDRREAIKKAISLAEKDDIVLIAGKGHETSQIFKDKRIYFDDREIAIEILKLKFQ